jgi:hypothetical protein
MKSDLTPRRAGLTVVFACGLALASAAGALQPPAAPAAAPPAGGGKPGTTPPAAPEAVNFADEPLRLDSVGLTIRLPVGALVQTKQIAGSSSVTFAAGDGSWVVNIQTPRTESATATVKDAADLTIKNVLMSDVLEQVPDPNRVKEVVASRGVLMDNPGRIGNLRIAGSPTPGERFYLNLPSKSRRDARIVQGYTIFRPHGDQFVAFELICDEKNFAAARRVYELAVATAVFEDPATLEAARRDAVKTGAALLSRLTPGEFDALAQKPKQWFRFSKPAPSGAPADAEERGYRGLRYFRGTRAMIDPKVTAGSPKAAASKDNPAGYLAELQARQVRPSITPNAVDVIDVQAVYFMTPDRATEAWAIQMIVKEAGQKPVSYSETATRQERTLTVINELPGRPVRTISPVVPGDGYLCQVEKFVLPRLIVQTSLEGEVGFYAYQTSSENIALRRDKATRDAAGLWTVETREREGLEPQVTTLTADGEVVRSVTSDGVVMEPMPLEAILKLWREKGLPTGVVGR